MAKRRWAVTQRYCNHSAFNGYKYTSSKYSTVVCFACRCVGRTKAGFVDDLPDGQLGATGQWEFIDPQPERT